MIGCDTEFSNILAALILGLAIPLPCDPFLELGLYLEPDLYLDDLRGGRGGIANLFILFISVFVDDIDVTLLSIILLSLIFVYCYLLFCAILSLIVL